MRKQRSLSLYVFIKFILPGMALLIDGITKFFIPSISITSLVVLFSVVLINVLFNDDMLIRDEMAKNHDDRAKSFTLTFAIILAFILWIIAEFGDNLIPYQYLAFFYGFIFIAYGIKFIILEKGF